MFERTPQQIRPTASLPHIAGSYGWQCAGYKLVLLLCPIYAQESEVLPPCSNKVGVQYTQSVAPTPWQTHNGQTTTRGGAIRRHGADLLPQELTGREARTRARRKGRAGPRKGPARMVRHRQRQGPFRSHRRLHTLEQKRTAQRAEATEALARLTGSAQRSDSDSDADMDRRHERQSDKDPWATEDAILQQQQKQKSLLEALQVAKTDAEKQSDKRNLSRTPRRTKDGDEPTDSHNKGSATAAAAKEAPA